MSPKPEEPPMTLLQGEIYQIRVQGALGNAWSGWFDGLTVRETPSGETLLTGFLEDQAALYGLLRKLRDVGLPLVSLQRLESPSPSQE
ncbi:hypothetical protein [Deinococcus roseus]|uniref:Uncharacterized protein n=1 Tax=Deinococcus roseus TaxID=392414 RepID=A0ABQ2D0V3_9DEIO|nr:hypothetical protein [Deinococcus roseus]GGJ39765.1 hypothetical protein GCM10008938_27240 [Deinococcus roseus]